MNGSLVQGFLYQDELNPVGHEALPIRRLISKRNWSFRKQFGNAIRCGEDSLGGRALRTRFAYAFLTVLLAVLVGCGGYYLGLVRGFRDGFAHYPMATAAVDAADLSLVLREIRDGNVEQATALLESKLDIAIVRHASFLDSDPLPWNTLDFPVRARENMKIVAKYRQNRSPIEDNEESRTLIENTLERYANSRDE